MSAQKGFSSHIIRLYVLGASSLFIFLMYAFHAGTMLTENALLERRVNMVAPFHFERFQTGELGVIAVDPLLTIYDSHDALPKHILSKVNPDWTGSMQLLLEDDREYQIVATRLDISGQSTIVYAIENSNAVEWNDTKLIVIELIIGLIGLIVLVLTMLYMIRAARRIAAPFLSIAKTLENESSDDFGNIQPNGETSLELVQITAALNNYRARLAKLLLREKSFTQYISHELRTPMMIIKGAISNARRNGGSGSEITLDRIEKATADMEDLTQTFLMLARDSSHTQDTRIDKGFIESISRLVEPSMADNGIAFRWQLVDPVVLNADALLVKSVILNLLKNAIACSINGNINLFISESGLQVIDDGIGLDRKPVEYEGFGIGLILVQDICEKYGWHFELKNNADNGCTASLTFDVET